jgi:DNA-binding transcriptional ArsR family regulator
MLISFAGRPGGPSLPKKFPLDMTPNLVTIKLVMTDAVTWFRAMADETRWRIVRLVAERALCVCELADILEMPQSSVSSHVQIIRKAGLLESETCGKWTYFRIHRDHLGLLKAVLKQFPASDLHTADADRAEVRLARREDSCCPGPVRLAKARKPIVQATQARIPTP